MITTLIIFWILLLIVCGALGFACWNLMRKLEQYEKWISYFGGEIENVYKYMKEVDNRNLFDKDDDVGAVFTELLRITKEFNEKIK